MQTLTWRLIRSQGRVGLAKFCLNTLAVQCLLLARQSFLWIFVAHGCLGSGPRSGLLFPVVVFLCRSDLLVKAGCCHTDATCNGDHTIGSIVVYAQITCCIVSILTSWEVPTFCMNM